VVTVDIFHGAAGHLHEPSSHVPLGGGAVPLSQGGEDCGVVLLPYLPQVRLPRTAHRSGVRDVKDIFQAWLSPPVLSYDRYALGTGLYPPAHGAVPQLHAGTGSCIRALGVDQELLVKGVFVEPGGRVQIAHPAIGVPRDGLGGLVCQLGYLLQFACHWHLLHKIE